MGPADSDSLSRVESYSGCRYASTPVVYGAFTLYGRRFHAVRLGIRVDIAVLQPRPGYPKRFRLVRVRSPLLTESIFLFSPGGNEMFQFPPFARVFRGRRSFDSSPGLFAAFHALSPSGAQTSPTRPY